MKTCDLLGTDGKCGLGLHDGTPTKSQCDECPEYMGRPRGLGDKVAKVLVKAKIDRSVKRLAGERDCGCGSRRAKLNRIFPSKD